MPVKLYGPAYSTYARTARLALEEKGVPYELHEVDILSGKGNEPAHLARQPWGKVPAFDHDGFGLFETFAIARYVDEGFPGPALQPSEPRACARMTQICAIIDSYGYGAMVGKVFWQEAIVPMQGGTPDAARVAEGRQAAEQVLDVIHRLMEGPLMCGEAVTLADLHVLPPLEYYRMTKSGASAFASRPKLAAWWDRMNARESVVKTRPKLG
ncbi:glutathione S-transferase family protein [Falsiroseomonas oryziterrae]|uniref:glutathione S-transferase family protein n=1 Tax=Falsiroseomonas oryziterrae TaxID=2911368 RepID=UPI001F1B2CEB|nr:glutathione S-transferase family protein [Roseomonas sp. NPKOSM-4]